MRLMSFLKRPFPVIDNNRKKLTAAFSFGAFVFLFLYIFKPFGLDAYNSEQVLFYTLGFGGITFSIMFLNLTMLDRLFPSFFKDELWTVGKEIFITLIYIALIGLANYLFAVGISITRPTLNRFLYLEVISLCLAIFPVIVWTLIRENMLLRNSRMEADKFIPVLHPEEKDIHKNRMQDTNENAPVYDLMTAVEFTSETESTSIKTNPENVFFISSADNYIRIYMTDGNETVSAKLLRSSLKRTEDDLKNHPQFFRCHRAFIVNLLKVQSVTGNARGLKLSLKGCNEEVPVSRSLNEEIREKLKKIHSR